MGTIRVRNKDGDERNADENRINEAAQSGYYPVVARDGDERRVKPEYLQQAYADGFKLKTPESFEKKAAADAWSTVMNPINMALEPIAAASHAADKYTMAPIRAGYGKAQELNQESTGDLSQDLHKTFVQDPAEIGKAMYNQFGEDPSKAPTYGQIAEKYGLSGEKTIPYPTVKDFGTPNARLNFENAASPADIVGGAVGMVLDPMNRAVPAAGKIAQPMIGRGIEYAAEGAAKVARPVGKTATRILTPIRGDEFDYYLNNHPRLVGKTAEPLENISHDIIDDVGKIRQGSEQTAKTAIGPEHVEPWQQALENDKKIQGELSAKAEDVLGNSNITAPRKELEKIVQGEYKDLTPDSPNTQRTIDFLKDIKSRLSQNYDDYMSGNQLRGWLRNIRKEIEFSRSAGEYTDDLDKALINIQKKVSDGLKDTVPEYKSIMDEMSTRNRATQAIIKDFSGQNQSRGMSKLRDLWSDDPGKRQIALDTYTNYAKENGYPDLESFLQDQEKLRTNALESKEKLSQISKFSENPDNAIKNMSRGPKTQDRVTREQLEKLDELTGKNYGERIADRNVLESFGKEGPKTGFLPGLFGLGLGASHSPEASILGMVAGAGAGLAQSNGGKIARYLMDKSVTAKDAVQYLGQKMANPSPAFQKYADYFASVPKNTMLLNHQILWNNDPEYRKALSE